MQTGTEKKSVIEALKLLNKSKKVKLFKALMQSIRAPERQRTEINVGKISRYSKPKSVVVVPGKVLGFGQMEHAVEIVALDFSEESKRKITAAGGSVKSFKWLTERGAKDVILLK